MAARPTNRSLPGTLAVLWAQGPVRSYRSHISTDARAYRSQMLRGAHAPEMFTPLETFRTRSGLHLRTRADRPGSLPARDELPSALVPSGWLRRLAARGG